MTASPTSEVLSDTVRLGGQRPVPQPQMGNGSQEQSAWRRRRAAAPAGSRVVPPRGGTTDTLTLIGHLADVLRKTGRLLQAQALLEHVVEVREERRDHPDVAGSLVRYGVVLRDLGELERSVVVLDRAVHVFAHRIGERHQYVADAKLALAESLRLSGDIYRARIEAADSLAIFEAACGPDRYSTLRAQQVLSELGR
jgi:tetratricopeptide (TPR) repeat protein